MVYAERKAGADSWLQDSWVRSALLDRQLRGNNCKDFSSMEIIGTPIHTSHADVYHVRLRYEDGNMLDLAVKHFVVVREELWKDYTPPWTHRHRDPAASFHCEDMYQDLYRRSQQGGASFTPKLFLHQPRMMALGSGWQKGPSLDSLIKASGKVGKEDEKALRWLQANAVDNLAYQTARINSESVNDGGYLKDTARAGSRVEVEAICKYLSVIYYATHINHGPREYDHTSLVTKIQRTRKVNLQSEVEALLTLLNIFTRPADLGRIAHGDDKPEHNFYPEGFKPENGVSANMVRTTKIDFERVGIHRLGTDIGSLITRGPANLFIPGSDEDLARMFTLAPTLEAIYSTKNAGLVEIAHDWNLEEMRGQWSSIRPSATLPKTYAASAFFGLGNGALYALERQANLLRRPKAVHNKLAIEFGLTKEDLRASKVTYLHRLLSIAEDHRDYAKQSANRVAVREFFSSLSTLLQKLEIMQEPVAEDLLETG